MFFPFIGLVVTLSLWSTILTLRPNDPREDYVRRLTSTIGITAVISGSLDLANGIINTYGSKNEHSHSDAHTDVDDIVNGTELHTTETNRAIALKITDLGSLRLGLRQICRILAHGCTRAISYPCWCVDPGFSSSEG